MAGFACRKDGRLLTETISVTDKRVERKCSIVASRKQEHVRVHERNVHL